MINLTSANCCQTRLQAYPKKVNEGTRARR